jgi:hypothetical protein
MYIYVAGNSEKQNLVLELVEYILLLLNKNLPLISVLVFDF